MNKPDLIAHLENFRLRVDFNVIRKLVEYHKIDKDSIEDFVRDIVKMEINSLREIIKEHKDKIKNCVINVILYKIYHEGQWTHVCKSVEQTCCDCPVESRHVVGFHQMDLLSEDEYIPLITESVAMFLKKEETESDYIPHLFLCADTLAFKQVKI